MNIVDCHCHLSFLTGSSLDPLILASEKSKHWVMGGYDPQDWRVQMEIKAKYPDRVKTVFGLHPWYVKSDNFALNDDFEKLKELIFHADLIGEVGLDFSGEVNDHKKQLQIEVLERHLSFGSDKPFVFHMVQAHGAALALLNDYSVRGFVHSFSGSVEVAEKYFTEGILLSFGPSILNDNFKKAREALETLPLEAILIESDWPSFDQKIKPEKTDPNRILLEVASEVAKIKSVDVEVLLNQVETNFNNLMM